MTSFLQFLMGMSFAFSGIAAVCGALVLFIESLDRASRQMIKPAVLFAIFSGVFLYTAILLWGLA
jgi:hypothetical protein